MKIQRLSDSIIIQAIADKYVDNNTKKTYFNLSHGVKGVGTWRWRAGLTPRDFTEDTNNVVLNNDNYNLAPIYKNGTILKDKKDNVCYNIVIDNDPTHKNDILLLWTIPSRGYTDIDYSVTGNIDILGSGINGKLRGDTCKLTVPAPILEISGDCTLTWTGVDRDNNRVKQTICYTYYTTSWVMGKIIISEDTNV